MCDLLFWELVLERRREMALVLQNLIPLFF
jgi:hypothetical protein